MQNEKLSLLMDGESIEDSAFLADLSKNEEACACWNRYHVIRDVMRGSFHPQALQMDISVRIASALEQEDAHPLMQEQPLFEEAKVNSFKTLWTKISDTVYRVGQVGLAACVTLVIITAVQYQNSNAQSESPPVLATTPVGVFISPVGGQLIQNTTESLLSDDEFNQEISEKMNLLLQDYEFQRRINASR